MVFVQNDVFVRQNSRSTKSDLRRVHLDETKTKQRILNRLAKNPQITYKRLTNIESIAPIDSLSQKLQQSTLFSVFK
jgi:hypothetical protein